MNRSSIRLRVAYIYVLTYFINIVINIYKVTTNDNLDKGDWFWNMYAKTLIN